MTYKLDEPLHSVEDAIPDEVYVVAVRYSGVPGYEPGEEWDTPWLLSHRYRAGVPYYATYDGAKKYGPSGYINIVDGKERGMQAKILRLNLSVDREMP